VLHGECSFRSWGSIFRHYGEAGLSAEDALVWSRVLERLVGVRKRVRVLRGHDRSVGWMYHVATRSQYQVGAHFGAGSLGAPRHS